MNTKALTCLSVTRISQKCYCWVVSLVGQWLSGMAIGWGHVTWGRERGGKRTGDKGGDGMGVERIGKVWRRGELRKERGAWEGRRNCRRESEVEGGRGVNGIERERRVTWQGQQKFCHLLTSFVAKHACARPFFRTVLSAWVSRMSHLKTHLSSRAFATTWASPCRSDIIVVFPADPSKQFFLRNAYRSI